MQNWYGNNNGAINLTFSGIMTSKFKRWSRSDRHHWSSSGYWLIVASGRCWMRRRDVTTIMATLLWHRYSSDYALVLPQVTVCWLSCPSDRRCAEAPVSWHTPTQQSSASPWQITLAHQLPLYTTLITICQENSSSTFYIYTTKQPDEDYMDANFPAHLFPKSQINSVLSATRRPWARYSRILKRPDGELNCWTSVFDNIWISFTVYSTHPFVGRISVCQESGSERRDGRGRRVDSSRGVLAECEW